MKIAFDVGGVLSKYPDVFRPLLMAIHSQLRGVGYDVDIHVVSDMHPKSQIIKMLGDNDFGFIQDENVHSADYEQYGEMCKAVLCEQLGIDILIDDFPGYVASGKHVRLLVMPEPTEPYYHDTWKANGSFGRRKHATRS